MDVTKEPELVAVVERIERESGGVDRFIERVLA